MSLGVFQKILPSLKDVETLILNGIGESLLHHDLLTIITLAREVLPATSSIGVQSNGLLLTKTNARDLLRAGLSTMCLSVDRFEDPEEESAGEHSFRAVQQSVDNLSQARHIENHGFRIGLEIVLTRQTINDLPGLVAWAIDNGIDYILSSHLILYDKAAEQECLFNPHPPETLELFTRSAETAASKGLDFTKELEHYRRHAGTQSSQLFTEIFNDMLEEARRRDLQLNLDDLDLGEIQKSRENEEKISAIKKIADTKGLDLFIPPFQATSPRECRFLKEKTLFIAANGDIMPCHFLWHSYGCRILKEDANVIKRPFGNVSHKTLLESWHSKKYLDFRKEAESYGYTYCWTCCQGPCPMLLADDGGYANDCIGSQVPCGHCQWNLGGIRCL
ncbi:radical SAM protein [Desulforhopalus sp. 52FAK]